MSDPTPAPALTDEQIDYLTRLIRVGFVKRGVEVGCDAAVEAQRFDTWHAAVIARAKREERERIGDELAAWLDAENAPPIWHEAVDIADPTWCDRHPEEADHATD